MEITRALYQEIQEKLATSSKIIVLYGPRQVGKTTLVETLIKTYPGKTLKISGDDLTYHPILSSRDLTQLTSLVSGYTLLFIDEAQLIPTIGINLKLLRDHIPHLKIIVTGSSSFDLANQIQEPLTGRTWTYTLYPLAFMELHTHLTSHELHQKIPEALVYGSYPAVWTLESLQDKEAHLRELTRAYLYKDVLEMSSIKHSQKLHDLLRLIAFQIGSQVSLSEVGQQLGLHKETVAHYIDLLEKAFVLFRLRGFSRNLRKEVTKMDKLYFYDLGVRNALLNNFSPLSLRQDTGQLWENFIIIERKKYLEYHRKSPSTYFWRTYTGAELDYIEESGGHLSGFEFKYNTKLPTAPHSWTKNYPEAHYTVINKQNAFSFILP